MEQKCPAGSDESLFLTKTFKFFDIQNQGSCTFDQFKRAITKVGVVVDEEAELETVFAYYDKSGDARIDYKEFIAMFQAGSSSAVQEPARMSVKPAQAAHQKVDNSGPSELDRVIGLFRDKVKMRGARGIIGLKRVFDIMDDDQSGCLSIGEFEKALRDFKVGISEEYIPTLFNAFDLNHDGTLSAYELISTLCPPLNDKRRQAVQNAFWRLDTAKTGKLDMLVLRDMFRAERHPDVQQGRRTDDQVLIEFLETFEAHHTLY